MLNNRSKASNSVIMFIFHASLNLYYVYIIRLDLNSDFSYRVYYNVTLVYKLKVLSIQTCSIAIDLSIPNDFNSFFNITLYKLYNV